MNINPPNYKDGSIVNLMSSISEAFGKRQMYKPLKILPPKELKESKNIVLMILDGLGFKYLVSKGKNTQLKRRLRGAIDSVFPPTTVSAITTFMTGTAPQQHAFTGWLMHLKELGVVSKIFRSNARIGGLSFDRTGIDMREILPAGGFSKEINVSSYVVTDKETMDSGLVRITSRKSKVLGYATMAGFFRQIKKAVELHNRRKYIYAYWSEFDTSSHAHGANSKESEKQLRYFDNNLKKFIENIRNTTLIITADHGFVDTPQNRVIKLENHPKLKECLVLPLCGESRTIYCYVRPSKTKQFENYVNKNLKKFCRLYKSEELVKRHFFGLFKPSPKLLDRIGDYVLVMKENYILKDLVLGQKMKLHIGYHGGASEEERVVPLVLIKS